MDVVLDIVGHEDAIPNFMGSSGQAYGKLPSVTKKFLAFRGYKRMGDKERIHNRGTTHPLP